MGRVGSGRSIREAGYAVEELEPRLFFQQGGVAFFASLLLLRLLLLLFFLQMYSALQSSLSCQARLKMFWNKKHTYPAFMK